MENENIKTGNDWQPYKEYMEKRSLSKGARLFIEDADMLNHQVNRFREENRIQKPVEKDGETTVTEGSASTGFGVHSRVLYNSNGEETFVKIRDEVPLRGAQAVKGFALRPRGMRIESVVRESNDYRISDIIKDLERLKNSYGDLPCIMRANDGGSIKERMMTHIGKENLIVPDENLAKTLGVECRKSPVCEKRGFQIALGLEI